jgi:rSAM/selenodomain-associated transferase 2
VVISVVIPVLNEEKLIEKSVLEFSDWSVLECIVADGGSTDRTVELASKYAKVLVCPPGRAVQMNAAAQEARGEILWFIHVDTTLPPDAPNYILKAIDDGYVGGAFSTRFDEPTPFWDLITMIDNQRTRIFRIYYGSRAMFVRKDLFHRLGGFPEIPFLEDVAFSRLMRKAGKTIMLEAVALESFRRFRKVGPFRQLLLDILLLGAFEFGVSSERLAKFYGDIR